uniref:Uncharacterized protein n=1 Tax=Leersia perrieri TaxID=77586 RepID=A0A0D9WVU0_9ORYZ
MNCFEKHDFCGAGFADAAIINIPQIARLKDRRNLITARRARTAAAGRLLELAGLLDLVQEDGVTAASASRAWQRQHP